MSHPKPQRYYDVITFGTATRDVFMQSKHFRVLRDTRFTTGAAECFALGTKIEVDSVVFETGGGATNSAVTFARLGYRTAFIGRVGKHDIRGKEILKTLENDAVDTSLVQRDPSLGTAYSVVLLTLKGERTALVYRGASARLSERDIPWQRLNAKWFYITSIGGDIKLLSKIIKHAKDKNIRIAINPGVAELEADRTKMIRLLRQVDMLFVNDQEAAELTGLSIRQDSEMFKRLCISLPGLVIITAGKKGAFICDDKRRYRSGVHNIRIVETTGAGDAFGSGFLAAYMRRPDIAWAMKIGTANSESVLGHIGAKHGIISDFPKNHLVKVAVSPLHK